MFDHLRMLPRHTLLHYIYRALFLSTDCPWFTQHELFIIVHELHAIEALLIGTADEMSPPRNLKRKLLLFWLILLIYILAFSCYQNVLIIE